MYDLLRNWAKENGIEVSDSELEKIVSEADSLPSAELKIMLSKNEKVKKMYNKVFSWLLSSGYNPNKVVEVAKNIVHKNPKLLYSFLEEVYLFKSPYGAITYALAIQYRSKEFSNDGDISLLNAINSLGPIDKEKKQKYRKV